MVCNAVAAWIYTFSNQQTSTKGNRFALLEDWLFPVCWQGTFPTIKAITFCWGLLIRKGVNSCCNCIADHFFRNITFQSVNSKCIQEKDQFFNIADTTRKYAGCLQIFILFKHSLMSDHQRIKRRPCKSVRGPDLLRQPQVAGLCFKDWYFRYVTEIDQSQTFKGKIVPRVYCRWRQNSHSLFLP